MYFGNVCHGVAPPPLLARPAPGRTQAPPDVTPLLSFHLLPRFTDMARVHKAVIGSGPLPTSPLKRRASSCGVCQLRFNSDAQAASHYDGTKHAKRLKALDATDSKVKTSEPVAMETTSRVLAPPCSQPSGCDATSGEPSASNPTSEGAISPIGPSDALKTPPGPSPGRPEKETQGDGDAEVTPERETEEERAVRLLYCSLCKVAVNSASQLQAHNSGTKHKTMLEARSGDGAIKAFPRPGVKAKLAPPSDSSTGLQNKTFHCEICDVHVNSETQLKQHISSRRHKDRAAGKPAKPKFGPYAPTLHHQGLQAIHLALLRKNQDLTKPLASGLIHRRLSAAAASVASLPSFHLRAASNPSPAVFQSQALLHPAPGPVCSLHARVLFSPY